MLLPPPAPVELGTQSGEVDPHPEEVPTVIVQNPCTTRGEFLIEAEPYLLQETEVSSAYANMDDDALLEGDRLLLTTPPHPQPIGIELSLGHLLVRTATRITPLPFRDGH